MTTMENRLTAAGRALRTGTDIDVDAALADVVDGTVGVTASGAGSPPRRWALAAAAVVLVTGAIAAGIAVDGGTDDVLVTGEGASSPAPDRLVTFDGIGDVGLGDALSPDAVDRYEGTSCGHWGPIEPSHDGDEPLRGLVAGADTATPTVATIMVWDNPRYRTAQGAGVSSTLAELEAAYGDALVVDRADGWELQTDGLVALYQDVAAIRSEAGAITFYLRDDVVQAVKVSAPASWGDDEGCA